MNITKESNEQFSANCRMLEQINNWSAVFGAPISPVKGTVPLNRYSFLMELIEEECREVADAHLSGDLNELKYELGDLLWVTIRAFLEMGENPISIMDKIYNANMSKACKTEEEANQTIKAYEEGNHPLKMGEKIKAYYELKDNYYIIKRKDNNKILKSINTKSV